jgi:hypothetical protein
MAQEGFISCTPNTGECPDWMSCYKAAANATDSHQCLCSKFFGFSGPECAKQGTNSWLLVGTTSFVIVYVMYLTVWASQTISRIAKIGKIERRIGKGPAPSLTQRASPSAATTTTFAVCVACVSFLVWQGSWCLTALRVDWVFERDMKHIVLPMAASFSVMAMLNVSMMWVELALASKNLQRVKVGLLRCAAPHCAVPCACGGSTPPLPPSTPIPSPQDNLHKFKNVVLSLLAFIFILTFGLLFLKKGDAVMSVTALYSLIIAVLYFCAARNITKVTGKKTLLSLKIWSTANRVSASSLVYVFSSASFVLLGEDSLLRPILMSLAAISIVYSLHCILSYITCGLDSRRKRTLTSVQMMDSRERFSEGGRRSVGRASAASGAARSPATAVRKVPQPEVVPQETETAGVGGGGGNGGGGGGVPRAGMHPGSSAEGEVEESTATATASPTTTTALTFSPLSPAKGGHPNPMVRSAGHGENGMANL